MAVLFVSHRRPQVTVVARSETGWASRDTRAGQNVEFTGTLELHVSVDELYAGIVLEDATRSRSQRPAFSLIGRENKSHPPR